MILFMALNYIVYYRDMIVKWFTTLHVGSIVCYCSCAFCHFILGLPVNRNHLLIGVIIRPKSKHAPKPEPPTEKPADPQTAAVLSEHAGTNKRNMFVAKCTIITGIEPVQLTS